MVWILNVVSLGPPFEIILRLVVQPLILHEGPTGILEKTRKACAARKTHLFHDERGIRINEIS